MSVNSFLIDLDYRVFLAVNSDLTSQWLDPVMALACQMGTVRIVYPLSALLLFLFDRTRIVRGMISISAVLFLGIFVGGILKDMVSRERPNDKIIASVLGKEANVRLLYVSKEFPFVGSRESTASWQNEIGLGMPRGNSFPSGHAIVAFGVAAVLARHFMRFRNAFFICAVIASISRIYLGVHFLTDVVFGGIIGLIIARLVLAAFDQGWPLAAVNSPSRILLGEGVER